MLKAGRSEPWPQILRRMTGDREMNASALVEYFDPLCKWLYKYRKIHGYKLGWKKSTKGYNSKGVKKTSFSKSQNIYKGIKLPDLRTALEEMQPDRYASKKSESALLSPKSSIMEAAKVDLKLHLQH